jgi:hypothetical protein
MQLELEIVLASTTEDSYFLEMLHKILEIGNKYFKTSRQLYIITRK